MALTQHEKAAAFRALHEGEPFLIPNPWDAGSARVLAALGFQALASTSSGFAFTLGRLDGEATLDEVVAHAAALDAATRPARLGRPRERLRRRAGARRPGRSRAVAAAGAVGGSIEDWDADAGIYETGRAAERVAAAVEAARGLDFPFTLTARAENHIRGNPDLDDTIARLQAYEAAGADVLYAPGLRTAEEIRAVCEAVEKPVNVLALPGLSLAEVVRRGRAAGQRRRRTRLGSGPGAGRRGRGAPGRRRLLGARGAGAAPRLARLPLAGSSPRRTPNRRAGSWALARALPVPFRGVERCASASRTRTAERRCG